MAQLADDPRFAPARRIVDLLRPFPGRAEFAVRLALICALTVLDVEIFRTPEPALTIYVVFFLVKPDRATSVLISLVFALLITFIIGALLLLAKGVIDQPVLRVTAIAAISFCLLFAASASKLKPVGSIIALIAGYALDVLGSAPFGEVATRALLYAWLFVLIPAGISIVVNLTVGPSPRRLVQQALAHRLKLAASVLRDPAGRARDAFDELLREGLGEIPTWLKLAGVERADPADVKALAQAARSTCALFPLIEVVVGTPRDGSADTREDLAACLEDMASILQRGGYPLDIGFEPRPAPEASTVTIEAFRGIKDLLRTFAVAPDPEPAPAVEAKAKAGFFVPDAFTNPVHVQYALKATAAAMICYLTYSLLDWPGIHTCFITCYIISLGTVAETVEKLTLRILGCLIGAALGIGAIVFVLPGLTSIGELVALVAIVAFASGWIAGGSPRISYVGFQVAFAFFLSVVQGSAPAFDLTIARDRVIGILFGNLVVALIFTQLWPVTVTGRIDPAIAALLRKLASLAREGVAWKRWALAAEVQAALGAVDQDVGLTRYEPLSARPPRRWTERRERILSAIDRCQGPLLLEGRPDRAAGPEAAVRLLDLADALDGQGPDPRASGSAVQETLKAMPQSVMGDCLGVSLTRLEQALAGAGDGVSEQGADYAVA